MTDIHDRHWDDPRFADSTDATDMDDPPPATDTDMINRHDEPTLGQDDRVDCGFS